MKINIYKRYQGKKYINGEVHHKKEIENVVFKEEGSLDVVHPILKANISSVDDITKINGYNYMYIPQLRSWYWLTWHTEGMLIVFEGERDPLKTFWNDIKDSTQYITRAENIRNYYIVDNQLPIHSNHDYVMKKFGDPVYDKNCMGVILETIGKGGTPS